MFSASYHTNVINTDIDCDVVKEAHIRADEHSSGHFGSLQERDYQHFSELFGEKVSKQSLKSVKHRIS